MGLFLVPTPIGNLADFTFRAVETLRSSDLILCEDTRTSGILLRHYQISKPTAPFHQHNEHHVLTRLVEQLAEGKTISLLTDAGTPGISDPGFLLVRACAEAGIPVSCLPGPTAFVPALVQSGIPGNRFCFEGFLPLKKGRQTLLSRLAAEERTIILYESPHRLARTLRDLGVALGGDRPAAVCRELSKMFEETRRGSLQELTDHYTATAPKGEIVLVVAGIQKERAATGAALSEEDGLD
jgi:16S rRNA (cytidine1402-2'-O)-methyltransferase